MSARDVSDPQLEAPADIFDRAGHRAHRLGVNYAGAVTPAEAYRLSEAGAARIVDVRTPEEWREVGHVVGPPLIEWPREGGAVQVKAFLDHLRKQFDPSQPVLFLCRSGVRSHYAAHVAALSGFTKAYNVLEGFEGHPGAGDGWRTAGLPWERS